MFSVIKNKYFPFWLLTITLTMFLIVSQLIQDGAFMDGMLYVSVSKNLADGIGTFWDPHFCKTYQSSFHEQPPLYFGLLALFYKVLGSSMYVERLFCFICFLITAFFIHKFWKRIYTFQPHVQMNSWFPVLLWLTIPICFWAYTNFVEETLMGIFDLLAVYFLFIALFEKKQTVLNVVFAGVFVFLASLTKGPQGMFPIAAVGFYWLVKKDISLKRMLGLTLLLTLVPFLIYGILALLNEQVITSFEKYLHDRIIHTFSHKNDTTQNRFEILIQLFWHLLPIACISVLLLFFTRKQNINKAEQRPFNKIIVWLVFIGLSGSVPLMITYEQRGFYLVTTLPFFAIAIAMLAAPGLSIVSEKINVSGKGFKIVTIVLIALFIASVGYSLSRIGKAKRDANILADVYTFGKLLPRGTTISIPAPMCMDFSFKEYMIRYFYISSDDTPATHQYMICRKDLPKEWVPPVYRLYPISTKEFDLYIIDEAQTNEKIIK